MGTVNIAGLDKAELLAALVNGAKPLGLGFLHDTGAAMTKAEAQRWVDEGRGHDMGIPQAPMSFDYVCGRPIKCDISGNEMRTDLYNRDQGDGAAERVVASLRAGQCNDLKGSSVRVAMSAFRTEKTRRHDMSNTPKGVARRIRQFVDGTLTVDGQIVT